MTTLIVSDIDESLGVRDILVEAQTEELKYINELKLLILAYNIYIYIFFMMMIVIEKIFLY